jgi:hypothetical protein
MADSDLVDRYMQLVERFERMEADKKLLWHEMQTTMEAMTEAETAQLGEKLRNGHGAARQALDDHMRQRNSPPGGVDCVTSASGPSALKAQERPLRPTASFSVCQLPPLGRHGHQLRSPYRIIDRFGKFPAVFGVFAIPFCSAHLASRIVPTLPPRLQTLLGALLLGTRSDPRSRAEVDEGGICALPKSYVAGPRKLFVSSFSPRTVARFTKAMRMLRGATRS